MLIPTKSLDEVPQLFRKLLRFHDGSPLVLSGLLRFHIGSTRVIEVPHWGHAGSILDWQGLLRFHDGSEKVIEVPRWFQWLLWFHKGSVRGLQWLLRSCDGKGLQWLHKGSVMITEVQQWFHNSYWGSTSILICFYHGYWGPATVQQGLLRFHEGSAMVIEVLQGLLRFPKGSMMVEVPQGVCNGYWDSKMVMSESTFVCCCQCLHYCCSFMNSHINKLKEWLFYIYLLTTITKALYQPSEKGKSLLFTCPQITEESSVLAAARMCLHMLCNFYQIESYHSSLSHGPFSMHFNGTLILLYFIEMLPHMVSSSLVWN